MRGHKNNGIILTVILAVIFGLLSGIIGELVSRAYILGNHFNIPLFGDINLSQGGGESHLVIRGAKNVIVEQDTRIFDTAQAVSGSIVRIYARLATSTAPARNAGEKTAISGIFDASAYYRADDGLAGGYVITSDGWIISGFMPPELKNADTQPAAARKKKQSEAAKKYVIITRDRKIHDVDEVIIDEPTGFSFWRVNAVDLPVRRFAYGRELKNGQLIFAANADGWVWPTSVSGIKTDKREAPAVKTSDRFFAGMILASVPADGFAGSCLFNLNGDMAGFIGKDGKALPMDNYGPAINGLLKNKNIARPALGINYIDLSGYIYPADNGAGVRNGALIAKNSAGTAVIVGGAADLAGLKEGDIVTSAGGRELNADNDLREIINDYVAGDEINIVYLREGEKKEVKVKLQELK